MARGGNNTHGDQQDRDSRVSEVGDQEKGLLSNESSEQGSSSSNCEASTSKMSDGTDPGLPVPREKWARKTDFLLSVAGGFIGLGNVWRFPYLCYKNGGGAFLIPYLIFMIGGGIPIFFLEVAVGQYMSEGGVTSWRMVPIATGIGYASMVIVSLLNIYYIVILAWAVFYLFQSFTLELPWAKCGQYWNTQCCVEDFSLVKGQKSQGDDTGNVTAGWSTTTYSPSSSSISSTLANLTQCEGNYTTPETEFWERRVLGISTGLGDIGGVRWELALCLLASWAICYFCIWKGVKSTGKVVYFTATFPFLMLIVLLVRGLTLPGAMDGIYFYLVPKWERLKDPQVWLDAGTQIFFSYAICLGAMVSLGSYNKFHNNCYRDCVALSLLNSGTSFISGFAIFSVLGFMANERGVGIDEVAESGPGLAFIAYPKALTLMPLSTVWAVLFFVMILLLGLDSQFVEVEGFVTSIVDIYPRVLRRGHNREYFIALVCFVSYLIGLLMVTNGGMYVFQLFDYYAASGLCLLWVAFFEAGCITWIYGAEKFWQKITDMIRYRPVPVIKYLWLLVTPVITTATFIYSMANFKPLVYNKTYKYPPWGEGIGWILALSSMIVIPGYALYRMLTTEGTLQERWQVLTTPNLRSNHPDYKEDEPYEMKKAEFQDGLLQDHIVEGENPTAPSDSVDVPPDYMAVAAGKVLCALAFDELI